MSYRPKGETTHYILRVASASSSTAVTDSLDFQVADTPLQIQFAYCKMCSLYIASLRGPPIGGQDNDGVSLLCSAPYTLLPLRGISPQGETRNLRRKTESHILHVPLRHSPFWWLAPPPCPMGSMPLDSRVAGLPYESSSFATPAVRLVNQKEGPFMGRLRAYFDQLAHPMQDVHSCTVAL